MSISMINTSISLILWIGKDHIVANVMVFLFTTLGMQHKNLHEYHQVHTWEGIPATEASTTHVSHRYIIHHYQLVT